MMRPFLRSHPPEFPIVPVCKKESNETVRLHSGVPFSDQFVEAIVDESLVFLASNRP